MLTINVNVNKVLLVVYSVAALLLFSIYGYEITPIIYEIMNVGWAIANVVLLVFAYLAFVAGLMKEYRWVKAQ